LMLLKKTVRAMATIGSAEKRKFGGGEQLQKVL